MTKRQEELKGIFMDLISIPEVYPHEDRIIAHIEEFLDGIGVEHRRDEFNNLYAFMDGEGEPLLVSTHMDVPEPNPDVKVVEEDGLIRTDGNTILGADPKAGLAPILLFLKEQASKSPEKRHAIEVILTRGEEAGLVGAHHADYSLLDSRIGVVVDNDGPVTHAVMQAPAAIMMDAIFHGKSAHPSTPAEGVNTLQAAAAALAAVPWGHSTEGVTWNIGTFRAGTARNTIPGKAEFEAELRGYDRKQVTDEAERITGLVKEKASEFGVECDIILTLAYEDYHLDQDNPCFERLDAVYRKLDMKPNYHTTHGASDANVFNTQGIFAVAVGCACYNAHQFSEYTSVGEMEEIVDFLHAFYEKH